MAVISQAQYIALSDYLAAAKSTLLQAKGDAYQAVYEIALYDDITPSIDLLAPFFASYEAVMSNTQNTTSLNAAVAALNNHVLRRTRSTLDLFLQNGNAPGGGSKVDRLFAEMSESLGFSIHPSNIQA